jgi:hypothetical protein
MPAWSAVAEQPVKRTGRIWAFHAFSPHHLVGYNRFVPAIPSHLPECSAGSDYLTYALKRTIHVGRYSDIDGPK